MDRLMKYGSPREGNLTSVLTDGPSHDENWSLCGFNYGYCYALTDLLWIFGSTCVTLGNWKSDPICHSFVPATES